MTTRQIASKLQIVVNIKKCLSLALDTLSSENFTGPGAVAGTCPSGAHSVLTTLGYQQTRMLVSSFQSLGQA